MPLKDRGSVSARLSVWFSRSSSVSNCSNDRREDFQSAGVEFRQSGRAFQEPETGSPLAAGFGQRAACRASKSKAARFCLPASLAPGFFQCSRPAIIRCSTSHRSPSSPMAIRLPMRLSSRTRFPSADAQRRLERPQQEWTVDANRSQHLADDPPLERLDVDGDVGQLGHRGSAVITDARPSADHRRDSRQPRRVLFQDCSFSRTRQFPIGRCAWPNICSRSARSTGFTA